VPKIASFGTSILPNGKPMPRNDTPESDLMNNALRAKIGNFAKVSQRAPVIVFTDLDRKECAPSLVGEWRQGLSFDAPNL
ncbi:hypothetical protein, partial [Rathayibacter tritici]